MQTDPNAHEDTAKRRRWLILSISSMVLAPCALFAFGVSQYWSAPFWLFCILWSVTFVVGLYSSVRLLIFRAGAWVSIVACCSALLQLCLLYLICSFLSPR